MIRLSYSVVYPKIARTSYPEAERELRGVLAIKDTFESLEEICDILFAGFGNHPGNESERGLPDFQFTTGDAMIDTAHRRWAIANVRSMSVGDVIHFGNSDDYYICDSSGWFKVTGDIAKTWLKYTREYGCCSFELNQWKKAMGLDS